LALQLAVQRNYPDATDRFDMPFGGYHFIALGDFAQHLPPSGVSLFHGAADSEYLTRDFAHLPRGCNIKEKTHLYNVAGNCHISRVIIILIYNFQVVDFGLVLIIVYF